MKIKAGLPVVKNQQLCVGSKKEFGSFGLRLQQYVGCAASKLFAIPYQVLVIVVTRFNGNAQPIQFRPVFFLSGRRAETC